MASGTAKVSYRTNAHAINVMVNYEEPWGDEVGVGWALIVMKCHRELQHLDPGYRIAQIKEKFGGLRYYFDSSVPYDSITYDIMRCVVNESEAQCARTCELCGAEGTLRNNGGWYKTLCDQHTKDKT